MSVNIYNAAGEKVLAIEDTVISSTLEGAALYYKDEPSDSFNPAENPLEIRLYGVNTPGQAPGEYSVYYWNGDNLQGQPVSSGSYYVIVSTTDSYGGEVKHTLEVQLISTTEYAKITIYNSAGEIVKIYEKPVSSSVSTLVTAPDTALIGGAGQSVVIGYAPGEFVEWDGKNEHGELVASGVYEIKVEQKFETGYTGVVVKSVTIFREGSSEVAGNIKIQPNPYVFEQGSTGRINITWTSAYEGKIHFKVYNSSGEMVNRFKRDLSAGFAEWVPSTTGGYKVSSGVYILVIEAVRDTGERMRKIEKIAVIRLY